MVHNGVLVVKNLYRESFRQFFCNQKLELAYFLKLWRVRYTNRVSWEQVLNACLATLTVWVEAVVQRRTPKYMNIFVIDRSDL